MSTPFPVAWAVNKVIMQAKNKVHKPCWSLKSGFSFSKKVEVDEREAGGDN